MRTIYRGRGTAAKLLGSIAIAVVVLGFAPTPANATLMTSYWTTVYAGGGYIAYTSSSRPANLEVESDWSSGSYSGWAGNSVSGATSVEVNTHVDTCVGSFTISSQHRASDPATGEYEWQTSGGSASCSGGGSSWDPNGDYCQRNAYLVSQGLATKDPSCP
jgi:hypothetical protein